MCSDGESPIEGINCNDQRPNGWVSVNKWEAKSASSKDWTGKVQWQDLNDHYSYQNNLIGTHTDPGGIHKWNQRNEVTSFQGGWIGNCQQGREWQYDDDNDEWVCGAADLGPNPEVLVDFSTVKDVNDMVTNYKVQLKIDSSEMEKSKTDKNTQAS